MSDDDVRYVFFIYDDDEDDPRFSFWMLMDDVGVSLYERPPDGVGMWLKPEQDSSYDEVAPTDGLERALAGIHTDGIPVDVVGDLPSHERHFVSVIHGTATENADAIPSPVWSYLNDCADRYLEDSERDADE